MKVSYKREMRHNYLILEAMEDNPDSFEIRMLAGNVIEGLLRFRLKQEDQARYYYYEITSKQPLSRMLEFREIRRDELRQLISGIGEALSWIENYLLQESHILLEPEYIYIEPESFRIWLCYVPGYQGDFPAAMERLLHYLLKKADHQDNDTVVLAYRLYQESQKDYFGIDDLLRVTRESGNEGSRRDLRTEENGKTTSRIEGSIAERSGAAEDDIMKAGEKRAGKTMASVSYTGDRDYAEDMEDEREDERESEITRQSARLPLHQESKTHAKAGKEKRWKGLLVFCPLILIASQACLWFLWGKEGLLRYGIFLGAGEAGLMALLFLLRIGVSIYRRRQSSGEMAEQGEGEDQWRMTFAEDDETGQEEQDAYANPYGGSSPDAYSEITEGKFAVSQKSHLSPNAMPFSADCSDFSGNTVLLSEMEDSGSANHVLKSLDPSIPDISIPYFPFLIGKQEGIVDYVLAKDTVSRLHLRIDQEDNACSITDLNSSNGTRVGERLLNANESCDLDSGDKVVIADISFIFY